MSKKINCYVIKLILLFGFVFESQVVESMNIEKVEENQQANSQYFDILRKNTFVSVPRNLYHYLSAEIVFVVGTSSAGKTTLINQLSSEIFRTGIDSLHLQYTMCLLNKFASIRLKKLLKKQPIYQVADCFEMATYGLKRDSKVAHLLNESKEWQELIKSVYNSPLYIRERHFFEFTRDYLFALLNYSNKYSKIVIDAVYIAPFMVALYSNFIKCKVITCYLYVSPKKIMQNMTVRNKKAILKDDPTETRDYFPFMQYMKIYEPSPGNQGILVGKKEFENIPLHSFKDANRLRKLQQYLIKSWFSEKNEITIIPKYPYDILTNDLSKKQLEDLFQLN